MSQVEIAKRAYEAKQAALTSVGHRESTPDRNEQVNLPRRVVRLPEVLRLTGIKSRETIRSLEQQGLFPRRFALIPHAPLNSRSVPKGWDEGEVQRWIEERASSGRQE